jgi:hypothetical protein
MTGIPVTTKDEKSFHANHLFAMSYGSFLGRRYHKLAFFLRQNQGRARLVKGRGPLISVPEDQRGDKGIWKRRLCEIY